MSDDVTWGIVSTVRGDALDILRFAAYHLDLGVDRLYIYLDEPNPQAFEALDAHPKVDVCNCDDAYWGKRNRERPEKHQLRQTANSSFTYRRCEQDWLAHIDLDEFLWPSEPISSLLGSVPENYPSARVRPVEAIAEAKDLYKAFIPIGPDREALIQDLYPNYGAFVLGGFLSHVQGKLFVRTGMRKISFRIHNLFQDKKPVHKKFELPQIDLCHRHAPDWDHWQAHYQFRMERGSYQPGMSPNIPRELGGLNKNELFNWIEEERGEAGLRAFYDELSGADPDVRARLQEHGLIKHRPLELDSKLRKHFLQSV